MCLHTQFPFLSGRYGAHSYSVYIFSWGRLWRFNPCSALYCRSLSSQRNKVLSGNKVRGRGVGGAPKLIT